MKRLLNIDTLEKLMQIVIICIVAAFVLNMLESCSEERMNNVLKNVKNEQLLSLFQKESLSLH